MPAHPQPNWTLNANQEEWCRRPDDGTPEWMKKADAEPAMRCRARINGTYNLKSITASDGLIELVRWWTLVNEVPELDGWG